jgi:hypothetical protein
MSKIFGSQPAAPPAAPASPPPGGNPVGGAPTSTTSAPPVAGGAAAPAAQSVDINAVLNEMAAKNPEKLDWKRSIVDLMKLVGMDSSLSARKELAKELNYTGDTGDSATINIWLHKAVLKKLSENGGKVPPELLD